MGLRSSFRYIFYPLLVVWFVLLVHLGYRYTQHVSHDTNTKSGTFVEGISTSVPVSYLPYTSFSDSNRFYQTMMFDSCLDYSFDENGQLYYLEDLCIVETEDEKTYTLTVASGSRRSDERLVSLDDLYFTYRQLLVSNVWNKSELQLYSDVSVTREDDKIVVAFPESSFDNRIFLTHFVLPASLRDVTYDDYVTKFLTDPVWSDCASIFPQIVNDTNLVFDLGACDDSYLLRYQMQLFDVKEQTNLSDSIYDVITLGDTDMIPPVEGFSHMRLPIREYGFLFFNTTSPKLSAKIQRSLGGLVFHGLKDASKYTDILKRNHLGFDVFLSTGTNIEKYLLAKNPTTSLDKYDLEKINVAPLPQKIALNESNDQVYFLETVRGYKTIQLTLPDAVKGVRIGHNDSPAYVPKTFESGQDDFFFSISTYNDNLVEGRNTYAIEYSDGDKWRSAGSFDVYYLTSPLEEAEDAEIPDENKLQVVYYADTHTDAMITLLQSIFESQDIAKYFQWIGFETREQFQGKLLNQDYDLVVATVDLGQRNDLATLFSSQSAIVNPSLYTKDTFVTLLAPDATNQRDELMGLYSSDVPFVVLGQLFDSSYMRSPLLSYIPESIQGMYHFKKQLYSYVNFGGQQGFTRNDIFNWNNVVDFFSQISHTAD